MIGPFDDLPIKAHISPSMTREKQDSDTRRTIMDISWPSGCSVNGGVQGGTYFGTTFDLHYPSVDDLVNRLNTLGPSAKIFKANFALAGHSDISELTLVT